MSDVETEAERFLEDRPGGEDALAHLLEVDADADGWSFDDVAVDSGTFGEIVSRGLVTETDEGYALAEAAAIRRALGEDVDAGPSPGLGDRLAGLGVERPAVDRRVAAALLGVLAVLAGLRSLPVLSVFRDGDVVLMGNDPYSYQHWTRYLLAEFGRFDPGALSSLPPEVASGDVAYLVALWALVSLAPGAADALLALAPVLIAVATGLAVYWGTRRLTPDRRVALAAVGMLSITTVHAYRTSLGFADHHAFDYLLLAVVLAALVALQRDRVRAVPESDPGLAGLFGSRRGRRRAALLGVAVTAQVFAWRGSPILLAPLALYVAALALADVDAGRSPLAANRYLLVGLALSAGLSALAHLGLGWGESFRGVLPAAVLAGAVAVCAVGAAAVRLGLSARIAGGVSAVAVALMAAGFWVATDAFGGRLGRGLSWVTGAVRRNTAGTDSLFGTGFGGATGPLYVFGFVLVLALPAAAWLTVATVRGGRRRWLAPAVYFWYLLAWTVLFIRFGGPLAVAAAPFAGLSFVALAAKLDLTGWPSAGGSDDGADGLPLSVPTGQRLLVLCLLCGLVAAPTLVQTPIKQSQLAIDDDAYAAAAWIEDDAADRELTYPENYVLSRWGRNRMYNHFASGQSADYLYAADTYASFGSATDTDDWYGRFSDRVGYVVFKRNYRDLSPRSSYDRLFDSYGSETDDADAVTRFRAVYAAPGGSRRVFTPVPGAVLTGRAPPNSTVSLSTPVDLVHDSFTYRRTVRATRTGRFAARVPHPGSYAANATNVSEADVRTGGFVDAGGSERSHWSFDEGRGPAAFDDLGRNHGWTNGTRWVDGGDGGALAFDGDADVAVAPPAEAEDGLTLSTRFRVAELSDRNFETIAARAPASGPDLRAQGYALALSDGAITGSLGDGNGSVVVDGPTVTPGEWHRATLSWNGTHLRLFLDGELVGVEPATRETAPPAHPLYFGGPPGWGGNFEGQLDEASLATTALDPRADALPGDDAAAGSAP